MVTAIMKQKEVPEMDDGESESPSRDLPKRYAVAIKWRYGNTWVDLALVFSSLYISKRWEGKIQRGKEKFLLYNFSSDILKA